MQSCACGDALRADASPVEWERLTGVPLDTNDAVSCVLLAAPTFARIDDLLQGAHLPALCTP